MYFSWFMRGEPHRVPPKRASTWGSISLAKSHCKRMVVIIAPPNVVWVKQSKDVRRIFPTFKGNTHGSIYCTQEARNMFQESTINPTDPLDHLPEGNSLVQHISDLGFLERNSQIRKEIVMIFHWSFQRTIDFFCNSSLFFILSWTLLWRDVQAARRCCTLVKDSFLGRT